MKLSADEAREVVYDDHKDFKEIQSEVTDTSRWSTFKEGVFEHLPTGKYYSVIWSFGSTEMQDESPFEYESEVDFIEVRPQEVTVIKYLPV